MRNESQKNQPEREKEMSFKNAQIIQFTTIKLF